MAVANQVTSNMETILEPYLALITALKLEVDGMKQNVNATQQYTPRTALGEITNHQTSSEKPVWKIPDAKNADFKTQVDANLIQGYCTVTKEDTPSPTAGLVVSLEASNIIPKHAKVRKMGIKKRPR